MTKRIYYQLLDSKVVNIRNYLHLVNFEDIGTYSILSLYSHKVESNYIYYQHLPKFKFLEILSK